MPNSKIILDKFKEPIAKPGLMTPAWLRARTNSPRPSGQFQHARMVAKNIQNAKDSGFFVLFALRPIQVLAGREDFRPACFNRRDAKDAERRSGNPELSF